MLGHVVLRGLAVKRRGGFLHGLLLTRLEMWLIPLLKAEYAML